MYDKRSNLESICCIEQAILGVAMLIIARLMIVINANSLININISCDYKFIFLFFVRVISSMINQGGLYYVFSVSYFVFLFTAKYGMASIIRKYVLYCTNMNTVICFYKEKYLSDM